MDNYKKKYLKYKNKYYNFKKNKMSGGNIYGVVGTLSVIALILSVYYMRQKPPKITIQNDDDGDDGDDGDDDSDVLIKRISPSSSLEAKTAEAAKSAAVETSAKSAAVETSAKSAAANSKTPQQKTPQQKQQQKKNDLELALALNN